DPNFLLLLKEIFHGKIIGASVTEIIAIIIFLTDILVVKQIIDIPRNLEMCPVKSQIVRSPHIKQGVGIQFFGLINFVLKRAQCSIFHIDKAIKIGVITPVGIRSQFVLNDFIINAQSGRRLRGLSHFGVLQIGGERSDKGLVVIVANANRRFPVVFPVPQGGITVQGNVQGGSIFKIEFQPLVQLGNIGKEIGHIGKFGIIVVTVGIIGTPGTQEPIFPVGVIGVQIDLEVIGFKTIACFKS